MTQQRTLNTARRITPVHTLTEPLLTADEVAGLLRCSASYVRKLAQRGDLLSIRYGNFLRFERAAVEAFIAEHREVG